MRVIGQARQRKTNKIKQAKDEAKAEVLAYKQDRERQYKELERKLLGDKTEAEKVMEIKGQQEILALSKQVEMNQDKVIDMLIEIVADVRPVLHKNYDGANN